MRLYLLYRTGANTERIGVAVAVDCYCAEFQMRTRLSSGVPRNFVRGGVQQIQLRTEDRDLGGGSPLVRGSGGSCNVVQEISFHIVKFS